MALTNRSQRRFYGPWITAAVFVSFGITVGLPYYGMPFFYDYFVREFGWTRPQITLGFPIGAVLSLWVGPLLVHRYRTKAMLVIGAFCTFLAFLGFGLMSGSLFVYYALWLLYRGGNIFCGPIPYQLLISEWFRKRRGAVMAVAYLGVGVLGGVSAKYIAQPLTEAYGSRAGLIGIGVIMLLACPLALFVLKDRPADIGQFPDGEAGPTTNNRPDEHPETFRYLLSQPAFWLLLVGSFSSIGAISAVTQHMKFIFLDEFQKAHWSQAALQKPLNEMYSTALLWILLTSNLGRLGIGYLADHFSKKAVMVLTYFLVALSVFLLLYIEPGKTPYLFVLLFGLGMGADYMMIPLVAAEQFGLATLSRAMAILLPADTIGQACVPYLVAELRQHWGNYDKALLPAFGLALAGAVAITLIPRTRRRRHSPESAKLFMNTGK
jgi:MFS family permease